MEMWQLQQLQGLPLEVKIRKTEERLKEFYDHYDGNIYISFSGGKDSTVLLDIARRMYPDIEAVFGDTGLEYPEIREFVKTYTNVTWVKPKMGFNQVIRQYGYPLISKEVSQVLRELQGGGKEETLRYRQIHGTAIDNRTGKLSGYNYKKYLYLLDAPFKISDLCCRQLKKSPLKNYEKLSKKYPVVATLTVESNLRRTRWLKNGCNTFNDTRSMSTPLAFWTEQDILNYLIKYKLPIASVYGKIIKADVPRLFDIGINNYKCSGLQRTGCMFCMFGVHLEKSPNRFEIMKITHPKQYEYCINKTRLYYNDGSSRQGQEMLMIKDDGSYMTHTEIEEWIDINKPDYVTIKRGLGLGEILDYIKVKY